MARKGNPGALRLVRDEESSTGLSAAILLRNIRPGRLRECGGQLIAKSEFDSAVRINVGGHRVRPKVVVMIYAQLNAKQLKQTRDKQRLERALARAPMLH
jgi:hypothetical protein